MNSTPVEYKLHAISIITLHEYIHGYVSFLQVAHDALQIYSEVHRLLHQGTVPGLLCSLKGLQVSQTGSCLQVFM